MSYSFKEMMGHEDGYHYVNSENGVLKVTGVGWLIRNGDTHSSICIENRVALTKVEQMEIGDKQPFMLDETTKDVDGSVFTDVYIANSYLQKMKSKGKDVKLTKSGDESEMSVLLQIVEDAKMRNKANECNCFC